MPSPATHTFVHLEVSSATVLNNSVNGPINYLIGRALGTDDTIEIEDSLEILSGANGDRFLKLPVGTTGQRPTGEAGIIRFNTSLENLDFHDGTGWEQPLTPEAVTFANLDANGDIGTDADTLAEGNHTHAASLDVDNMLLQTGLGSTFTQNRQVQLNIGGLAGVGGTAYMIGAASFANVAGGDIVLQRVFPAPTIEIARETFTVTNETQRQWVAISAEITVAVSQNYVMRLEHSSGSSSVDMYLAIIGGSIEYA